ncbi:MAG: twin-arginine translocase TatA/TatE family subunit [Chloroflexota bacterium]|nr:twin-arginine translocase TatA/TatE family subunit [Dehalococcoidia bacterium]MDW8255066.1 twin-arginine translocase TatA/TatE family subunit [Chloroflexota bacterium]
MFFPQLGPMELILILAIVLLIFGVGRLPEALGSIGRGIREFRKAVSGTETPPPASSDKPSAPPTA